MRKISCAECCYLNKNEKIEESMVNRYKYKCMSSRKEYIVGCIRKDSELKTMGCSDCNRIKVGTSFTFNKTKCFYCGSIQTENGRMYLVYNASTYVQNGFYVDVVEQNWFSEHIKEIVIEYQTKEQIEAIKQTAKCYKKRIEEREKRCK
nr:MAG TPA: hypothetical protein [Caudoviricetes sp.]